MNYPLYYRKSWVELHARNIHISAPSVLSTRREISSCRNDNRSLRIRDSFFWYHLLQYVVFSSFSFVYDLSSFIKKPFHLLFAKISLYTKYRLFMFGCKIYKRFFSSIFYADLYIFRFFPGRRVKKVLL